MSLSSYQGSPFHALVHRSYATAFTSPIPSPIPRPTRPRPIPRHGLLVSCPCRNGAHFGRNKTPGAGGNGKDGLSLVGCVRAQSPAAVTPVTEEEYQNASFLHPVSVTVPFGDRNIILETGRIGRQANASLTVTDGETILYTTVCVAENPNKPSDFAPLVVNYQERMSAAGRTSGGFLKRESRAKDHEILVCRLIDRPLRPIIAKGFNYEIQILSWALSYDGQHPPEPLAITAAGAALALSEIPVSKVVSAVRVGMVNGQFIINPTIDEMELSKLDLILAGTTDSVIMIEGYCDFLTEDQLLEAISLGQSAVSKVCQGIEQLVEKSGKPKRNEQIRLPSPIIASQIQALAAPKITDALQLQSKKCRQDALSAIEHTLLSLLCGEEKNNSDFKWIEDTEGGKLGKPLSDVDLHSELKESESIQECFDPTDVKAVFKEVTSKLMRQSIVQNRKRIDGRGLNEIRKIESSCGLLPRTHGSALFTRGETQAVVVTTLGGEEMGQRLDDLGDTDTKRFYFQYMFPPSAVGETGRIGPPSRREIGHGMLAERSLEPAIPSIEEFPYTIRIESTITESNGSSSMASVCGGCLSILDAGVPLKCSIAGVAMGLILNTEEFGGDGNPLILSDIMGSEDALGDMDFKVAGSEEGVTAFQMDIKVNGIGLQTLKEALMQAKEGRCIILGKMKECNPPPSQTISKYAPLIEIMQVEPEQVMLVIGSGGKTVKSIIEQSGVDSINVEPDGVVRILARSLSSLQMAKSRILGLTMSPEIGTVYRNCVVKAIVTFGCFVEIAPAREALCHISELSTERIARVEDVVNIGDRMDVKLIEINARGQLRVSRKLVLIEEEEQVKGGEKQTSVGPKPTNVGPKPATVGPKPTTEREKQPTVAAEDRQKPADKEKGRQLNLVTRKQTVKD